jgi:transcriptional regulator with XRE-family HTH domain
VQESKWGHWVKEERLARNLTRPSLAKLTELSPNCIFKIETGRAIPNLVTLTRIVHALGYRIGNFPLDAVSDPLPSSAMLQGAPPTTEEADFLEKTPKLCWLINWTHDSFDSPTPVSSLIGAFTTKRQAERWALRHAAKRGGVYELMKMDTDLPVVPCRTRRKSPVREQGFHG